MFDQAKEDVYGHIGWLARCQPPEVALNAFDDLMLRRITPLEPHVRDSLTLVIEDQRFRQEEGMHFLNRAYYTICNPWHLDSEMMPYLRQVIGRLEALPEPDPLNPTTKLLRERLTAFSASEYGDCLRRQMRLGGYEAFREDDRQYRGVVGDYLPDYFYLYQPVTRTPDIEQLEEEAYRNPEESGIYTKQLLKLRQTYEAIYRYRDLRRQGVKQLVNPTRLAIEEFEQNLENYFPHRTASFYRKAQELRRQRQPHQRYGYYRPQIRDYLMAAIASFPTRTQHKLSEAMLKGLGRIDDTSPMVDTTVNTLFARILDEVLLPEFNPTRGTNASSILMLERNMRDATPSGFTGMLLSLVLACPMVRFDLGKKLGYLYRYFELQSIEVAQWVVQFFEHLNLALVMNARKIGYFSLTDPLPELVFPIKSD